MLHVALHAPDGLLNLPTAATAGVLSAGGVGVALRQTRRSLEDSQVPLAGISAAFIFAAQMFNFPVAAGTTGHLLGGALAAVLLGPSLGALVVVVVVIVQALAFADGGITALGFNLLNMAIVPAFGGYAIFRVFRRLLPRSAAGVVGASALAAGMSVVLAAMAFSVEWLFGATAPVAFDTVFAAVVGVHGLIGIGEGIITGLVVAAVLAARPDHVYGARDLEPQQRRTRKTVGIRTFAIAGVLVALVFAAVVSQFAVDAPDGLERISEDLGMTPVEFAGPMKDVGVFSDYATQGVQNERLSLALAGGAGVLLTLALAFGIFLAVRDRSASRLKKIGA